MRWTRFDMPCHVDDADTIAALVVMETGRGPSILIDGDAAKIEAWVPESGSEAMRQALVRRLETAGPPFTDAVAGMTATSLPDTDWQFTWRNHYRPIRLGERLVIKPSWEAWPPEGKPDEARPDDVVIEIDPGSAFGTGSHPTTQLALMVLERYVKPGDLVLDIGCGSGILGLASLRLGARKVIGVDSDPGTIECASKNLRPEIDQGNMALVLGDAATGLNVAADVVVANINVQGAIAVGKIAAPLLRPGGTYIGTGLLESATDRVIEEVTPAGLDHLATELYDGWGCVSFVRPEE